MKANDSALKSKPLILGARVLGWSILTFAFAFVVERLFTLGALDKQSWGLFEAECSPWILVGAAVGMVVSIALFAERQSGASLRHDAAITLTIARGLVKWAFWSLLMIGIVDTFVSFLRVEGLLESIAGSSIALELGKPAVRGLALHVPCLVVALFLTFWTRSLCFPWLMLMVVGSELAIVASRFVYSYEQAFMSDLVRFWYAGLFLTASAETLIEEGHVRVDIVYATLSERAKSILDAIGAILFGAAFCWVILYWGMSSKFSVINGPLLRFEISQSSAGLYVKYLMAGLLMVFALSLLAAFTSYFFSKINQITESKKMAVSPVIGASS